METADIIGNALRAAFGPVAAAYCLGAIGLNMHYGYTGLLNFGQVGFMLLGAYGVAISVATLGWSMWVGLAVSIGLAVVLALALGVPTLRLRADYFAITTIAASEVLRLLFRSAPAEPITGGVFGLQSIAVDFYAVNPIPRGTYGVGLLQYTHHQLWAALVTWVLVGLATLLLWRLVRSPWGRVVRSIREDEDAARSLGKNVFGYKLQSLVIGGIIGGLAGAMFAISSSSANADTYQPTVTFELYAILILGGAASTFGPIVGATIYWFLVAGTQSLLRNLAQGGDLPGFLGNSGAVSLILVGLGLVLLMIYRPAGILGNEREMALDV